MGLADLRTAAALLILCTAPFASADDKTKTQAANVSAYFEKMLSSVSALTPDKIRKTGLKRSYPNADYEQVWDSLVKVVIQNGIIVHADKKIGLITAVSDLVTRGPVESQLETMGEASPLCNTIHILADRVDGNTTTIYLKAERPLNRVFFDLFNTQLNARGYLLKIRKSSVRQ